MIIKVLLADYAQTDDRGKINALGLGWSTVPTPLPQHAVAVIFEADWHEANERHKFSLVLVDEDGQLVAFPNEEGGEDVPVLNLEAEFEVGRPPGLAKGTPLVQTLAVNMPPGMPLDASHRYEYRVTAGDVVSSASFSVTNPF